ASAFEDNKLTELVLNETGDEYTIQEFGDSAFANNSLKSIIVPSSVILGPNIFKNNRLESIIIKGNGQEIIIPYGAFAGNPNLAKITLGDNITIMSSAFDSNFAAFYNGRQNRKGGTFEYDLDTWCTPQAAAERRAERQRTQGGR
ncbi:leucine-rich repeat domain-containing protein, partial [Treponema primitia]|uniref:leucine-rich repeat protein n=1 Tax=Treponema primitia TaxID=88058 RepID=UPI00397FC49C